MTTSGVEVFCKKGVKKKSLHFIWKHLWWSLFLIKRQAWDLLWRTSANYCFCTALASLAVPYLFYFIFSTFFFIITATTVNISDARFWFKLKKKIVSHFYWATFIAVIFSIRKTPTWKIPTHQTPLWKIPTQKIPTWNIPIHVFKCSINLMVLPEFSPANRPL